MTDDNDFKKIVRDRMAKTGESYQAARRQLERQRGRFSARVMELFEMPEGDVLGCIIEGGEVTRGMTVTVATGGGFHPERPQARGHCLHGRRAGGLRQVPAHL